ncbi:MAG TPA: hypothetical protein VFC84_13600 [Desulfosporosinus sp.]|nr:hypothetical protein [Desulfosporosinus sp.]
MSDLFSNQSFGRAIGKHRELPLYVTDEFVFYRCISFHESFYGKIVSELHAGNLRPGTPENRYSKLFPKERVSYWADSPQTSRAEVKYHNAGNNLLTFWAYDDATSTFPTRADREPLTIIDGRNRGFNNILYKIETDQKLTSGEKNLIDKIASKYPDCLVYESLRTKGGLNFLFFEKGFHKLSIREVLLRLGDYKGKNANGIVCAGSSDYSPYPENYGMYFRPIAKAEMNLTYQKTEEYKNRSTIYKESLCAIRGSSCDEYTK